MILLHDMVDVLHLPDADGGAVGLIGACAGGFLGVTAVARPLLGDPVTADGFLAATEARPL